MPECRHITTVRATLPQTWDFVREMDNWAPLLTGYQGHQKHSDKLSVWTLRGDVGMLSREVQLQVEITQWIDEERVDFTLRGLNEQVEGDGTFQIRAGQQPASSTPVSTDAQLAAPGGPLSALLRWLARLLFRAQHGKAPVATGKSVQQAVADVDLAFRLRMEAGGPMAPMMNALLQPALLPATEDLAQKIAHRIVALGQAEVQTGDATSRGP